MKTALSRLVRMSAAFWILVAGGLAFGFEIGYRSVGMEIRPYVDVSATYDSNTKLSARDKQSDTFWQTQLGLDLNLAYKWLTVNAAGYSFSPTYSDTDPEGADDLSGGGRVDLSMGTREKLQIGLHQTYERATDYSLLTQPISEETSQSGSTRPNEQDWSDRTPRNLWRTSVTVGRNLTDKIEADAGYTYTKNDYLKTDLNDSERNEGQLMLGYRITDKSTLFLDGRYATEDSDGYESMGTDLYVGPGWKTRMTEKVDVMGSVGYEAYRSGILMGQDRRSDVESIGLHLAGTWRPVDKLSFGVSGNRGVEASVIDANTREVSLFEVTTGYRLTDDLSCALLFSYRWDQYDQPAPGRTEARRLDSEGASFLVNYRASRCLTLYASATYEDMQSNVDDNSDQFRASMGARARF